MSVLLHMSAGFRLGRSDANERFTWSANLRHATGVNTSTGPTPSCLVSRAKRRAHFGYVRSSGPPSISSCASTWRRPCPAA